MRMRPPQATRTVHPEGETVTHSGWGALLPWLWPWLAGPALFLLAVMLRGMWAGQPWAYVGLTLATTGLACLAYRAGRARGPLVRMGAVAGTAGGGAWLVGAVISGPFTRPTVDLWVFGSLAGAIAAVLLHALRGNGRDGQGWQSLGDYLGLPGSRTLGVSGDARRLRTKVETQAGVQTQDDAVAAAPRIASQFGVPMSGVRMRPDPDNARLSDLTIVRKDLLQDPIRWPGPSARGASIAEPIVLGVRENGDPLQLWLPGDERVGRSATSVLINGMNGSGKSVAGRILLAEVLTRVDAEVWLIDTVKGAQFSGPFRNHVKHLVSDIDEAKRLITSLAALVSQRADELGERDLDQWVQGCGMPYLLVHIEEAAAGLGTFRPLAEASMTVRSVGIALVVSLQRAIHTNVSTDLRGQTGTVLAFGCKPGDEQYGLRKETLAAGAAPQQWGHSRPGYCYGEVPGTDVAEWSAPARTYLATLADVRAALEPGYVPVQRQPEPHRMPEPAQLLRMRVDAIRESGAPELRPRDLADVLAGPPPRSPAWLSGELRRMVGDGVLVERGRGVYGFADAA